MGNYDDKVQDVARFFNTTPPAVYRMTREQRLPPGSFCYLNERTVRYNLDVIKQWAVEGGGIVPPKKKAVAPVEETPGKQLA